MAEKAMTSGAGRWLLPLVSAGVVGCATPAAPDAWTDLRVESRGQDKGGEFCGDFSLTSEQAGWFMRRARPRSAAQIHDEFEQLPCWVRGTVRRSGGLWHWEIRAGGTARTEDPQGAVVLLGCNDCDAVLRGADAAPSR